VFTGIVTERGRIVRLDGDPDGLRLEIEAGEVARRAQPGDSISIDGCCLTVTQSENGLLAFDAVPESLQRTTLGRLAEGDEVNLEPALRAGDPLGGHYVQGHVDGVGRVAAVEREGESRRIWIESSPDLLRLCVEKGSIAVDGVSLTITALADGAFEVALVPHTLKQTTLGRAQPGDAVNLEVDILAKYVEKLVHPGTITGA
jgi:riboflavin synthase alpha subunit